MRITRVTMRGFKGVDAELDLAPVTVLAGPNWSGKSARLEATSLAALGYVADGGKPMKQGSDIFKAFASSALMGVGFRTDGALSVDRSWEQVRGSVRYKGPAGPVLPEELFDETQFSLLSGPQKVRYLFGKSGAGAGLELEKVADSLVANLKGAKLDKNTPETERALREVCRALVSELTNYRHRDGLSVQDALDRLAGFARDQYNAAAASGQRMEHTVQGSVEAGGSDELPPPPDSEQRLEAAREATQREREARVRLDTELGAALRRQTELEAAVAGAGKAQELRIRLAALENDRDEVSKVLNYVAPATRELDDAVGRARTRLVTADAASQAAERELDRVAELMGATSKQDVCPHCGQSMEKVKREALARLEKEMAELEKRVQKANTETKAAAAASEAADAERNKALKAAEAHALELEAARRWQDDLQRTKDALAALGDAGRASLELPGVKVRADELRARMAALDERLAACVRAEGAASVDAKRLAQQRAAAAARTAAVTAAAKARADAEAWKQLRSLVGALQKELVDRSVGSLVERVNLLCAPILPAPVEYRDGEFTFGGRYGQRSASDGQRLLLYAALRLALVPESPVRLATVGRFESLDRKRRGQVTDLALGLVEAGKLDQCLFVMVGGEGEDWYDGDRAGFKLVEVAP